MDDIQPKILTKYVVKYPVKNGTFDVLMKIDVPWTRRRVEKYRHFEGKSAASTVTLVPCKMGEQVSPTLSYENISRNIPEDSKFCDSFKIYDAECCFYLQAS